MTTPSYVRHERLLLKSDPVLNEKWLQDRIAEDPIILGLGEVALLDRERRQERAGRLDLLLADTNGNRRYEVEVMLGTTDESHIIRCIEYWDIERRRYPGYEHCAVLVAEDITTRFLNVLALMAGNIPLIVIQLNALKLDDKVVLDFVRVLDQRLLRKDDETEKKLAPVDKAYWNERSTPKIVAMLDELLELVNLTAKPKQVLNYNRYYVSVTDGVRSRFYIWFKPKKKFVHVLASLTVAEAWPEKFDEAGLSSGVEEDGVRVTLAPGDEKKHRDLLTALFARAVEDHLA